MKSLIRGLKALLITVAAYLIQVCVMNHLAIRGVTGSVLFAAIAVLMVSCGKVYAFCSSCLIGLMMESMMALSNVPGMYVIAYPVITMLFAQMFADKSERQLERQRVIYESYRAKLSERGGKEHWWQRLSHPRREGDLPAHLRIPLCAGLMDLTLNAVMCMYMYLIGEELGLIHAARILISVVYTVGIAVLIMVPLRYILRMYRWQAKRRQGGELL